MKLLGFAKFHILKQFGNSICLKKSVSNASKLLKQRSALAKQRGRLNILIYSKLLKFQASFVCRTASLPAVRPGSTRCRPPDFSQNM